MPYDATLDNSVFSKSEENENGRLTVSVYSYNSGPRKLQVSRETRNRDGDMKFAKLGRMSKDEVETILPLMKESIEHLD